MYIQRPVLSEYETDKLDEKIQILAKLTQNSKMARENCVMATVEYFEGDEMGKIIQVSGQVWKVGLRIIRIDDELIGMDSIVGIDSPVFTAYVEL